ncbi:MAG: thioredoxin-like domain-containing protein [Bacteroidota bacterium]
MKKFLLLLLCIVPIALFAQQTTLNGIVSGADGQIIRLIAYDDFVSKKIITLGQHEIGDDGSFALTFDIQETIMAFLDINYQRAEIFIEPGKTYSLEVGYDKDNHLESYFDRKNLFYDFTDADTNDLNLRIWKFNAMYNKFVMENFDHIYTLHDKSRVHTFREEVSDVFPLSDSGYFADYITYKLADVEQYARLKGKSALSKEYFNDQVILYDNVEYTYFFEQFFEKFLITSPDVITISDLIIAVNDNADHEAIMEALAGVSYLEDKDFRELVALHALKSLYYNGTYKKPQVLQMIRALGEQTRVAMHKRIATNLLESLASLSPGSPAPDLLLTSIAGQKFNLKNIKGKPILLTFFRSAQEGTSYTFDKIAELYNQYRSGLEVISVSMDIDPLSYLDIANSGNYYWTFAHYGNDPVVYDLYNIRDLPLYVLIDVEGNISQCPAPPPGDELERAIMKVIH